MRILIVEDSVPDAALVERELRRRFEHVEAIRVETPEAFAAALEAGDWDVVIADHMLPRFSSTDALRALQSAQRDIPLIVVSGKMGRGFAAAAMGAGASDYLLKSDLVRLGPAVERELRVAEVRRKLAASVTEHRRTLEELRQAQKLEAVGRLAAGIAHEINTPVQFIGDNARFLEDAFGAMRAFVDQCRGALSADDIEAARGEVERALEELDLGYLVAETPKAVARVLEGVQRVAALVRAMKEFAHPDRPEMVPADLNRALLATLEVSRNEYKYVADVQADLGEIPSVVCYPGELNQVFLNLVVNAAHAIEDVLKGTGQRGTIVVRTLRQGDEVVVAISDSGGGIPEEIRDKIFEPFFTTKGVGRGTGQGLAIARNIVARHRGELGFTTASGQGTTFFVRLPVDPSAAPGDRG